MADQAKARFTEISVERINVRNPDGTVRLVISHQVPDAEINGKIYPRSLIVPQAGLIFFNNEGFECGGLVFGGKWEDGKYAASSGLVFDRYNQQDIVSIDYTDINGRHTLPPQQ